MTSKERDLNEDDCEAAGQAFADAQGMPAGPERIAALKKAGQMRFDAFRRKQADLNITCDACHDARQPRKRAQLGESWDQ